MARRNNNDDDLFVDEELTAAFLGEESDIDEEAIVATESPELEDEGVEPPGQLALDVYETKEKLVVKCRVAGVNKEDLDVSIADNTLNVRGTLSGGAEDNVDNYFIQECYWGEFARSIALPVTVKEDEIEAALKDGVLTVSFTKVKQDTVKKIAVQ